VNESTLQSPAESGQALPDTPPGAAPSAEEETRQLREALETMRAEVDRLRGESLRSRAEMDNVRKRAQRDVEAAHKFGLERLVEALVPVKDSLDLGRDAADCATDIKSLREGVALTQQLFESAWDKLGVTSVDPLGQKFDPALHQAMMMEASASAEPGTVLRVLQKGYCLHERLVRPAMVIVARAADGA
jgi:molecular chaperone GrpE